MKQKTWPSRSNGPPFTAFPLAKSQKNFLETSRSFSNELSRNRSSKSNRPIRLRSSSSPFSPSPQSDYAALPYDILTKIAASFSQPDLNAASLVCKSWNDALRPLREAMAMLRRGKRLKHGRGGVRKDTEKAMELFLEGVARGSTLAMVDAGLIYWENGRREKGMALYRRAAEFGDAAGMCNLGIAFLQDEPENVKEAVKWLRKAACAGHVRARYQLALCLHQGRGVDRDIKEAAKWYLRAAEGGYIRAMYNVALCYSVGEGFRKNHGQAKRWMKQAAEHGHSKAQFEHGLGLFVEGELMKAVVYLELASRAGEAGAAPVKNVILPQLPSSSRNRAMVLADNWRPLPSSR